jgi:hypothetical protein
MPPVFVLLHSPAVGPATWLPVAEQLISAGYQARVPSFLRAVEGAPPFWPDIVAAAREDLSHVPVDAPVVLVAHSNAGLFLPLIVDRTPHVVTAPIFVDAALPALGGATPAAPAEFLDFLRPMAVDGRLPRWTDWWDEADLVPLFPDARTRRIVTDEQPNLPMSYFEARIPVPDGWDDHRCAYLLFSPAYDALAAEARQRGYSVAHLSGGHLHQLVDPAGTARQLIEFARGSSSGG